MFAPAQKNFLCLLLSTMTLTESSLSSKGSKNRNYWVMRKERAFKVYRLLSQIVATLPSLVSCNAYRFYKVIWFDIAYLIRASLFIAIV